MTRYEKLRAEGRFPFSFWCYCGLDILGPEAVKDWKDAGMTVAQTPGFNLERDKPEQMLAVLDACAEAGIWAIMGYNGVSFGWDPDSQAEEVERASDCSKWPVPRTGLFFSLRARCGKRTRLASNCTS